MRAVLLLEVGVVLTFMPTCSRARDEASNTSLSLTVGAPCMVNYSSPAEDCESGLCECRSDGLQPCKTRVCADGISECKDAANTDATWAVGFGACRCQPRSAHLLGTKFWPLLLRRSSSTRPQRRAQSGAMLPAMQRCASCAGTRRDACLRLCTACRLPRPAPFMRHLALAHSASHTRRKRARRLLQHPARPPSLLAPTTGTRARGARASSAATGVQLAPMRCWLRLLEACFGCRMHSLSATPFHALCTGRLRLPYPFWAGSNQPTTTQWHDTCATQHTRDALAPLAFLTPTPAAAFGGQGGGDDRTAQVGLHVNTMGPKAYPLNQEAADPQQVK